MAEVSGKPKAFRITSIDSLRGIASLMVVFYHLTGAMGPNFEWIPFSLRYLFEQGSYGVHIFFILSGYVIALSTEALQPALLNILKFGARRGVRLDPPYICSFALAIGLTVFSNTVFPDTLKDLPSLARVLSHVIYFQNILGFGDIVSVYWSLCYEIQMYLTFVAVSFIIAGSGRHRELRRGSYLRPYLLVWIPLFAVSIASKYGLFEEPVRGLAISYGYLFLLGAQIRWVHRSILHWSLPLACVLAVTIPVCFTQPGEAAAILFAVFVVYSEKHLAITRHIGRSRVLLFLGRISYSLYLVHPIIGWRSISVMRRLLGDGMSVPVSVAVFSVGIGVSIASAWGLYRFVEAPTIGLSRRIKLKKIAPVSTPSLREKPDPGSDLELLKQKAAEC